MEQVSPLPHRLLRLDLYGLHWSSRTKNWWDIQADYLRMATCGFWEGRLIIQGDVCLRWSPRTQSNSRTLQFNGSLSVFCTIQQTMLGLSNLMAKVYELIWFVQETIKVRCYPGSFDSLTRDVITLLKILLFPPKNSIYFSSYSWPLSL